MPFVLIDLNHITLIDILPFGLIDSKYTVQCTLYSPLRRIRQLLWPSGYVWAQGRQI